MSLFRRVKAPAPGQSAAMQGPALARAVEQLEAAGRTAIDEVEERLPLPFGAINPDVKVADYHAKWGEVVLYDCIDNAPFRLWLPSADRTRIGQVVAFKRVCASTNTIYICATGDDEIDGATQIPQTTGYKWLVAICLGPSLWGVIE